MVAAEQRLFLGQRVAHMVCGMAGGGDAAQREAITGEHVAITHHGVGHKIAIRAFFHLAFGVAMRSGGEGLCSAPGFQRGGGGRMIAVGVGDQDVADPARADRLFQRGDVGGNIRTGIDHRH